MKTFTKKIEMPRVKIGIDDDYNPRDDESNLSIIVSDGYINESEELLNYANGLKDEFEPKNVEEHIKLMKEKDSDIYDILPLAIYEHSGVVYRIGKASGWDCSQGFVFIMKKDMTEWGIDGEELENFVKSEIEALNEIYYYYEILDEEGNEVDSLYGLSEKDLFFELEDELEKDEIKELVREL